MNTARKDFARMKFQLFERMAADPNIRPCEFQVLFRIVSQFMFGDSWTIRHSHPVIAKELGISRDTVFRALTKGERTGYLTAIHQHGVETNYKLPTGSNLATGTSSKPATGSKATSSKVATGPVATSATTNNPLTSPFDSERAQHALPRQTPTNPNRWVLTERMRAHARSKGWPEEKTKERFEAFRDNALEKNRKVYDVEAAWRHSVRLTDKWAAEDGAKSGSKTGMESVVAGMLDGLNGLDRRDK